MSELALGPSDHADAASWTHFTATPRRELEMEDRITIKPERLTQRVVESLGLMEVDLRDRPVGPVTQCRTPLRRVSPKT